MTTNVGTIQVDLEARITRFERSMRKANALMGSVVPAAKAATTSIRRMETGMNRLAASASGLASAVAAFGAIKKGLDLSKQAKSADMARRFFVGLGGDIKGLREATHGMIDDATLMRRSNLAQTMGLDAAAFKNLAKIAVASAAKTGQSMTWMLDSIVTGTARQSRLMLDNLGILVSVKTANEAYAKSLGKTVKQMSDTEKRTSFLLAVQSQGKTILKELEQSNIDITNQFAVFETATKNAGEAAGDLLGPALESLVGIMMPVLTGVTDLRDRMREASPALKSLVKNVTIGVTALTILAGLLAGGTGLVATITVLGPALVTAAGAMFTILTPMLAIVAGVAAVILIAGFLRQKWDEGFFGMRDTTDTAVKEINEDLDALKVKTGEVESSWTNFWENSVLAGIWGANQVNKGLNTTGGVLKDMATNTDGHSVTLRNAMDGMMSGIMSGLSRLSSAMADFAKDHPTVASFFGIGESDFRDAATSLDRGVEILKLRMEHGQRELAEAGRADSGIPIITPDEAGQFVREGLEGAVETAGKLGDAIGEGITDTLNDSMSGIKKLLKDAASLLPEDFLKRFKEEIKKISTTVPDDNKIEDFEVATVKATKALQTLAITLDKAFMPVALGITETIAKGLGIAVKDADKNVIAKDVSTALADLVGNGNLDFGKISSAFAGLIGSTGSGGKFLENLFGDVTPFLGGRFEQPVSKGVGAAMSIAPIPGAGILAHPAAAQAIPGEVLAKMIGGGAGGAGTASAVGGEALAVIAGPTIGTLLGGPVGAAIAMAAVAAIGPVLETAGGMLEGAFNAVVGVIKSVIDLVASAFNAVVDELKTWPDKLSQAVSAITSDLEGGGFNKAIGAAFDPMNAQIALAVSGIGMFAGAVAATALFIVTNIGPILVVAGIVAAVAAAFALLLSPLLLTAAGLAAMVVGFAVFIALATVLSFLTFVVLMVAIAIALLGTVIGQAFIALGAAVLFVATVVIGTIFVAALILAGFALTAMAAPAVQLAMVFLSLAAGIAAFAAFLALITQTKGFEQLGLAIRFTVRRVTTALEPFARNLVALGGLFDVFANILLPLFTGLFATEAAARVLFQGFKFVAVAIGVLLTGFALLASVVTKISSNVALAFADAIDAATFLHSAFQFVADGFHRMIVEVSRGFRDFLAGLGVLDDGMRDRLNNVIHKSLNQIGSGDAAEDLSSGLRALATGADDASQWIMALAEQMGLAVEDLSKLSFEDALALGLANADLQAAFEATTEKGNEVASSLQNIPDGVKVALARFRAIATGESSATGAFATPALVSATTSGGGAGSPILIENLIVKADDPRAMTHAIMLEVESMQIAQGRGVPSPIDPIFAQVNIPQEG